MMTSKILKCVISTKTQKSNYFQNEISIFLQIKKLIHNISFSKKSFMVKINFKELFFCLSLLFLEFPQYHKSLLRSKVMTERKAVLPTQLYLCKSAPCLSIHISPNMPPAICKTGRDSLILVNYC